MLAQRHITVEDRAAPTGFDWDAESAGFGYDANGNMSSISGQIPNIAYDHRNLPVQWDLPDGSHLIHAYNADGQRMLKEHSEGQWSFYVMDGQQNLAVVDEEGFSHFNIVGNATEGRLEPKEDTRRYYLKDHLGSTRAVIDKHGEVLETHGYYPFGAQMPGRQFTAGTPTKEQFTSKERDAETGLDYFGARYYLSAYGRWNGVDAQTSTPTAAAPISSSCK
mgnify:CR=1 FL=1